MVGTRIFASAWNNSWCDDFAAVVIESCFVSADAKIRVPTEFQLFVITVLAIVRRLINENKAALGVRAALFFYDL